ncbi:Bcr/CflA family multidrug efflux MFS transporter [Xenorhabdus szentirmaii]|uniref:Bcr/CflA family multidrug efflux MFS transporter n=1 Tax=Xenorhabdus szentirmaii TaxID=290112 RepID=UPI0019A1C6CD|nr:MULTISPECIES: Bcr/CflA family multidrug efflux MFS transporter [unclassified Xenorhabdus]MBD2792164.1 Bcr/CflA family multidrug efflux MFS transporter [Xenorhabdus sp. CUL]MBD2806763.1 Bcr/CflA family multidrug efflux MFS transporter [Xenorhabdus sp. ZM]MBD2825646.1 Bcr/CflA family multidrug efflux MFS transporter [Xenorhabdus sp. 5]
MQQQRLSYLGLVLILGLLSMLMPLAIDMYLPSMPTIAKDFGVSDGLVQMTQNSYILGFAIGQLLYGPMSDSLGRKPVILGGVIIFAISSAACALAQDIDTFISMRFLHGFAAAAASVVINALMRDMFTKEEFSRSMSFVTLVMIIAPLLAPMLGGIVMLWSGWHAIFWSIAIIALIGVALVAFFIRETLPKEKRQRFHLKTTVKQFIMLFRQRQVLCYILANGFSFSGMFAFLTVGSFVYIKLNGVSELDFGYYFGLNVIFISIMAFINSQFVRQYGPLKMLHVGLFVQFIMGLWLLFSTMFDLGFISLVIGVAIYISGISMITSNTMAVILDDYPHMAGTVSSLAGTIRFSTAALVGAILSSLSEESAWPMVGSMALCAILAVLLIAYARKV